MKFSLYKGRLTDYKPPSKTIQNRLQALHTNFVAYWFSIENLEVTKFLS